MSLASPYYLLGLTGLLIPLLIHLWSRKTTRVLPFGSIRFLPDSTASRTFSLALTNRLLLLIRMLLLSVIVLILAGPRIKTGGSKTHRVLIEPALTGHEKVRQLLDSTREEVRYLSPGFPDFDPENTPESGKVPLWALVSEAAGNADSLTILAGDRLTNFQGKRPVISIPVHWIGLEEEASPFSDSLFTYMGKSGQGQRITMNSTSSQTSFHRDPVEGSVNPDTLRISLFSSTKDRQSYYIRTTLNTLSDYLDYPFRLYENEEPGGGQADWLILLDSAGRNVPAFRVIRQVDRRPGPVLLPSGNPGEYLLNGRLSRERMFDPSYLAGWMDLMDPFDQEPLKEKIRENDLRRSTFDPVPSLAVEDVQHAGGQMPITWPFWLEAFLLLIVERYLAHRRNA